ncbi:MAG: GAF domain-containing protein [Gemmatimonadaceae bacterium]|jgi:signal transduction histidine kinase/ActR/RegA family two-component response regulator/PAS domain-containing protein|nr:GAF domain-containing protein [Gemmatimonadaceae bacterium]
MPLSAQDEVARIAELHSFAIMDTQPEPRFDAIVALAAELCGTPYALITLLDDQRQWFKARVGFAEPETPREDSFCQYALNRRGLLEVPDTLLDPRFRENRYVVNDPNLRFYAGAPLTAPSGHVLGTLCVIDTTPRTLTDTQRRALETLSALVMTELQLRRALSAQEQLTQALEKQNRELVDAQAVAKVGSWVTDLSTFEVRWSLEVHRIFQTDPERFAVTHASFLERVHPEDRAMVDAAFAASVSHTDPCVLEHRILLPTGEVRLLEERWQSHREADGRITHAIGTCHDITEARAAEGRLMRLTRMYALLSEINDAIVHTPDRAQLYQRVCEIAVITGGMRAAWIGLKSGDVPELFIVASHGVVASYLTERRITWTDTPEGQGPTGRAIRGNRRSICNDIANDPAMRPWRDAALEAGYRSSASFPLRRDGQAIGALSLYADTVDSFDAEELAVLDKLVANLDFALAAIDREEARRLAQREREQLEQQLLRAQRLESIGTLAGGIAHDLNNVLTPIVFSIDLLRDGITDADLFPVLDEIARSARRGADMVRQLLLFARGSETERRPMSVDVVLLDIVATMQETFPRSISIRTELAEDLPWVVGDRTQLHQVVLNLCVNARDAMPDGGSLTLSAASATLEAGDPSLPPGAEPGSYVLIEVSDTGTGMDEDTQQRIFDPFFTTKAVGEGTGLGLSTSRSIVTSHGGFIHVRSRLGVGSTFRIGVPAVLRQAATLPPSATAQLPRGHGERVLLVDDEAPIRHLAATLLTSYGYRVTVAENGAEALEAFRAAPSEWDVVITDLMMPVMDGVEFIKSARTLRPDLPIIASSGFHDESRRQAVEALLVTEFLPKPYTAEAMLRALRHVLHQQIVTALP